MPSIEFHVKRSLCREDVAREIHNQLDNPGGIWLGMEVHSAYRKKTHDPLTAAVIGALVAYYHGENPLKGMVDALRHYLDDMLFLSIIRGSGGEEDLEDV